MEILIYSLSSCVALFSFYNIHKENEGKKKIQWLFIIVLLVINIFLFNYMIKCYEVPIHNNRISYFISNSSKYKTFSGYSEIDIVYDYNTFKELKKTNFHGEPLDIEPGIEVSTYIKCNNDSTNSWHVSNTSYSYFDSNGSHNNFGRWYNDGYKKLVEDTAYISFLDKNNIKPSHFEVDVENNLYSVNGVLYMLEINSSNRQTFQAFKVWKDNSSVGFFKSTDFEYSLLARHDSLAPHHDSVFYNHQWCYIQCLKPTINSARYRDFRFIPENDSILYQRLFISRNNFRKPNLIYTAEDISQAVEVLLIDNSRDSSFTNKIKKIKYDYNGPVEFSDISPIPDYKDISSLYFTDSLKIKNIEEKGLKFHVRFPDMENLQIIRMWTVTLLLGGFLGLLLKMIYNLFKERYYDSIKSLFIRHKNIVVNITIAITIISIIYIVFMLIMSHVDAFNLYDDRSFLIFEL